MVAGWDGAAVAGCGVAATAGSVAGSSCLGASLCEQPAAMATSAITSACVAASRCNVMDVFFMGMAESLVTADPDCKSTAGDSALR